MFILRWGLRRWRDSTTSLFVRLCLWRAFEADLIYDEEKADLRDAGAKAGIELEGGRRTTIKGLLLPPIPEAFPAHTQLVLNVWVDGVRRVHVHDDVDEVYVHLDEDEVPVFLRRLELDGFVLERRPPYSPRGST